MKNDQIGSVAYMRSLINSGLTAHDQLDLILNYHLNAEIDENRFLQLLSKKYQLAPQLAPTSYFYPYFRDLVVDAYGSPEGLSTDLLGRKIHLFRSYLDRQNIAYIRNYHSPRLDSNATDLQRLLCYLHDNHLRADFKTGANFHNRYHQSFTYPHNMKVQLLRNSIRYKKNPARMIEFIIDIDSGNFVSQWNIYHQTATGLIDTNPDHYSLNQLQQVANTESFNYGIPYGGRLVVGKYRHTHQYLDVNQPLNSKVRRVAKDYWRFPHDYNHNGNYADLIKGPQDIVAWRKVPKNQRYSIYMNYVEYLKEQHLKNKGINSYFSATPKYHQFCAHWKAGLL
ncbi:DUF3114 domain-containing protein [Limosilactobacillus albertensis]|uniref:DUF3114 domain-containing protein n=1 Tax=Limosilactobacillus albertensis TaxID=2759752 RepID=A0A839H181_9LACO|nr:DUF3114 domain-containing protein [Limosilactobacillus albertensis]MBB1124355.1 DUF3114 domain-containing protein [Limosilactobacillus albertensis]MCD7122234.1 DUF3114 domain-containing protein [Limosilactobacillus albertensis]